MRVQLSASAEDTWSSKFDLHGPAQISIVQGTADSTVSLRRYDTDRATVIQTLTMTKGQIAEVVAPGPYDIGVAAGNFGTGAVLITVEQ